MMSKSSTSFLEMIKELDFDENTRKFIVRLMKSSNRFTMHFAVEKQLDPELLTLQDRF